MASNKFLSDLHVPDYFVAYVNDLILVTKHDRIPVNIDQELIVDIDLAILGSNKKDYDFYELDIRDEYSWVSDDAFRNGRKDVLKHFLGKQLYHTKNFITLEERAKQNILESIKRLR